MVTPGGAEITMLAMVMERNPGKVVLHIMCPERLNVEKR
jgi:uncharacterized Fe-S cluster-containing protein